MVDGFFIEHGKKNFLLKVAHTCSLEFRHNLQKYLVTLKTENNLI